MGQAAARVDDDHSCPAMNGSQPHKGGLITEGCETVKIGGKFAARQTDDAACVGCFDIIATGSTTVSIGGKPAARLGDHTFHGGVITTGFEDVEIGD